MALFEELQKTSQHLSKHRQPHQADVPILRAESLTLHYESGPALLDVSFELQTGERLILM